MPITELQCGSIYLAKSDEDMVELDSMYEIGKKNNEDVRKIDVSEIQRMEPHLNTTNIRAGLYSPNEYVVDPFLLPLSNLYTALELGCKLRTKSKVIEIEELNKNGEKIMVVFTQSLIGNKTYMDQYLTKKVINCAGNYSDEADKLFKENKQNKDHFEITPGKGEYVVYTSLPLAQYPLTNGMVNCIPTKTFAGPYMYCSVYGDFVVGPTKITQKSKTDRECSDSSIQFLKNYAKKHFVSLQNDGQCSFETYSGLRPQDLKNVDYDIKFGRNNNWVTIGAIRSTGLTASRAIAQYVVKKLYPDYDRLPKSDEITMPPPQAKSNNKWKVGRYVFTATHKLSVLGVRSQWIGNEHSKSNL